MTELETKLGALYGMMEKKSVEAILLQKVSSFAWATGGSSAAINIASSAGEGALLITRQGHWLLTSNIEATRLVGEEDLRAKGWDVYEYPWYEGSKALDTLAPGLRLGSDLPMTGAVDLGAEITRLRAALLPVEQQRFRDLGSRCAAAMDEAIRGIKPGMNEFEIGGRLAQACLDRGVEAIVNLIAVDDRISKYRHPTYTQKKLDRYAMLVLCGRRQGLVASITRLIHFGKLPVEIAKKAAAVAQIDAATIAATRPGRTLGQVFSDIQSAYADAGYPEEWKLHHQGGPAAYEPREFVATPGASDLVLAGQAYAWNPSITGAKSEDTVLITHTGADILTETPGWPIYEIEAGGQLIKRPRILEV